MNEQTNPEPGVLQDGSIDAAVSRLVQSEDQAPEEEQPQETPQEAPQQEGQAEELTADDIPAEEPQPSAEAVFEIVHEGQTHKIATREEQIRYMQQGFDYTQKTQRVAEKDRQVSAQLQRLGQLEQFQPQLIQERAQVEALRAQVEQYRNFNWIKLAQDDPLQYPAVRAQYDVLVQAFQDASNQYSQREGVFKQEVSRVAAERRQAENARVPELIPEWKDQARREAGEAQLAKHYQETYGIGFDELNGFLTGAIPLAVAYKAMKYDQLLKSKTDKVKQLRTAPPVTVPGAKSGSAKADQDKQLRGKLRKTGSLDDAVAILLNRS